MPAFVMTLLAWGPVFFGIFLFGPMWAAAMDAVGLALPLGIPTLAGTMAIGGLLGVAAKLRGRWL